MVVDRTLYDVLGVEPDATQEQIRVAGREKSLEHHPDRGGSHEMMQKVNAAKAVLNDPEKRKQYDKYGLDGMNNRMNSEGFPFSGFPGGFDLRDLFGFGSDFSRESRQAKGRDIQHTLKVSLEDLYMGVTKPISVRRQVICTDCAGTGAADGISRQCTQCEGTGIETTIRRLGPMIQQMQGACSVCHGAGNTIPRENRCKKCKGQKLFEEVKKFDVNVVHGSQDQERIKISGDGNQIPNGEAGSIYVLLNQEPHPTFTRKGDDLFMKLQINLAESLCGFQRLIKLLDGHTILIEHPSGKPIIPNSYRSLKGYGMPNRHSHTHGDLVIQFDVTFPDEDFINNDTQRRQLEALLPPKKQIKLSKKDQYEEVKMSAYNISNSKHRNHHHNGDENGDEDHEPQGVRCAAQ